MLGTVGQHHPELGQQRPDAVDRGRALRDPPLAHPVQGEDRFATSSHLSGVYLVPAADAARFQAALGALQARP